MKITRPKSRLLLIIAETVLYSIRELLGILSRNGVCILWDKNQSRLVIIGARTAFLGVFGVILIEKIFKVHCSILVDICIALDLFCAIILGEACQVYRFVKGYDKIRHGMGALQFSILGYGIFRYFLGKTNKGKYQDLFAIIFGVFFGIAIECRWERYEWCRDRWTGVDRQKYVPEDFEYSRLPNGDLDRTKITPEQVLAFYTTREGREFALRDTMGDIVADTLGGILAGLSRRLAFHFKPAWRGRLIISRQDYFLEERERKTAEKEEKNEKSNE